MSDNDTLADALSRIMGGIGHLRKSAQAPAAMGGFKYVPITAVMNALQPLLVAESVVLMPRVELLRLDELVTGGGTRMQLATVHVQLHVQRSGDTLFWSEAIGQGADTMDKAVGKATTGAVKQALLNALAVPTGDDPDAGSLPDEAGRQRSSRPRAATTAGTSGQRASASPGPKRARLIARITELLADVEKAKSKDVNRYSVREHIRKTYPPIDSVTALFQKGTDDQIEELGMYVSRKLIDLEVKAAPQEPPADEPKRAEDMSTADALAAGRALLEKE